MDSGVIERRRVRLHRAGGSRSVVVPKEWLERQGIADEADLVLTVDGIKIEATVHVAPSLEDEPLFPSFLEMLLQGSLTQPEALFDATDLIAEDAKWLAELGAS